MRESAEDSKKYLIIYNLDTIDDFCEKNYSLKFNRPSFKELGSIYNEDYMNFF